MRFIRQTDKFRCGPVAIINALKYYSLPYTRKDIKILSKRLNTRPKRGTTFSSLDKFISKKFNHDRYEAPSIATLHSHIINKGPVLLVCSNIKQTHRHISLIIKSSSRYFYIVNFYKGETVSKVSKSNINSRITKGSASIAWLLKELT